MRATRRGGIRGRSLLGVSRRLARDVREQARVVGRRPLRIGVRLVRVEEGQLLLARLHHHGTKQGNRDG